MPGPPPLQRLTYNIPCIDPTATGAGAEEVDPRVAERRRPDIAERSAEVFGPTARRGR